MIRNSTRRQISLMLLLAMIEVFDPLGNLTWMDAEYCVGVLGRRGTTVRENSIFCHLSSVSTSCAEQYACKYTVRQGDEDQWFSPADSFRIEAASSPLSG
jgi:hypothetical protein